MPFLSPAKLLVILVVALIVLGPEKLPQVARQLGALWSDFRAFRDRLESQVRDTFPDLPSTDRITQAVRSPITFLDGLADTHQANAGGAGMPSSVDTGRSEALVDGTDPASGDSAGGAGANGAGTGTPVPDRRAVGSARGGRPGTERAVHTPLPPWSDALGDPGMN